MDPYREQVKEVKDSIPEKGESVFKPKEKIEKNLLIEDEISDLEKRIEQKKMELEKVRKIEGEVEKISEKNTVFPTAAVPDSDKMTEEEEVFLREIKNLSRKKQVETLISVAFKKGINSSVKIARSLNNAYVLDELHDMLVDELYKDLIEKGKIKEE